MLKDNLSLRRAVGRSRVHATRATGTVTCGRGSFNGFVRGAGLLSAVVILGTTFGLPLAAGASTPGPASQDGPGAPVITPVSETVAAGATASFHASGSGFAVYWSYSTNGGATWTSIPSATSTTYSFTASASQNGYKYEATFLGFSSNTTTNAATLTVTTTATSAPVITTEPMSQTVASGNPASFSAAASGSPTPTVEWSYSTNGGTTWTAIPSATSTTYSIPAASTSQNGYEYEAVFTNSVAPSGVATNSATLTVTTTAPLAEQEAVASYQALQENLYTPSVGLYLGLPSYTCGSYSCLWPFTNAMAATEYLYASPGGSSYAPDVAARLNGLVAYVDPREVSPNGAAQPRAFESAVAPPEGPGGSTYYDDNAWVALDLLDAYRLTGNSNDLALAQDTFNFVVTGWDTSQTDGCPGGVFWEDVAGSPRTTTANGGNADVGLELYQLTHDSADLSWAERMYQWENTCLESPSGLYYDHVNPGGSLNTVMWSYNQGTMVGAGALLYQITGNSSYLTAAQRTAGAAVSYFGTGTTLQNQGPAFNAIYFRDLFVLNQIQPNSAYSTEAQTYATFMWTQRDTSTGLFLQNGQTYGVNTTAPMVEIYSLLAGSTARP